MRSKLQPSSHDPWGIPSLHWALCVTPGLTINGPFLFWWGTEANIHGGRKMKTKERQDYIKSLKWCWTAEVEKKKAIKMKLFFLNRYPAQHYLFLKSDCYSFMIPYFLPFHAFPFTTDGWWRIIQLGSGGLACLNPQRTLNCPEEMVISSFNQILGCNCILDTHAFTHLHNCI